MGVILPVLGDQLAVESFELWLQWLHSVETAHRWEDLAVPTLMSQWCPPTC